MTRQKTNLRRSVWLCSLFLAAAGAVLAEDDSSEAAVSPTWYALSLQSSDAGLRATHFWSKGPMLRSETLLGGVKVVTLVHGENYVAYDALTRRGISIARDPESRALDAERHRPFGNEYEMMMARGAESVGEPEQHLESLRLTNDFGRRELQVSRDEDHIPIRLEVWHRASGQRYVTDYTNWRKGIELPDSYFEPEAGVELEELSLEAYMALASSDKPVESVPVLHGNLLAPQP